MPLRRIALGIDTTSADCSVALVDSAGILAQASDHIKRGHAEHLAPMVQGVLARANIKPPQVDRIAVCNGPGSFTGLRVGLSFAKGFALPYKIPVLGISALHAIAAEVDPDRQKKVASIVDVRRKELCLQIFDSGQPVGSPLTQTIDDARTSIGSMTLDVVIGDGASHLGVQTSITCVSAPILAWLSFDLEPALYPPIALYSRAPDAKLPGGKTLTSA